MPPILAINTCVYNDEHMQYWLDNRHHRFLPSRVTIRPGTDINQPGGIVEGVDDPEAVVYEVRVRHHIIYFWTAYKGPYSQLSWRLKRNRHILWL